MKVEVTLKTPVQFLKGVGPERSKLLARLGLETLGDVFYFFPRRYENRFPVKTVSELDGEDKECVRGVVTSRGLMRTKYGQTIFRAVISDGKSTLFGVWFNQPYLLKVFLPKAEVIFYGKAEREGKHWQMVHPEYEIVGAQRAVPLHSGRIVPIYPLTEDLSQKSVRYLIFNAVHEHSELTGELSTAFRQIHFPQDAESQKKAYERLVFEEFFLMQLLLQSRRAETQKENPEILHAGGEEKVEAFMRLLGFTWTEGQRRALADVLEDMKKQRPMNRLVQGDVGSGKTAVAGAALVFTVSNGFQGALMAPTEVLAQQHFYTLSQVLEPLGIACGYLGQGLSPEARQETLKALEAGNIQVVIGTHALIEKSVRFRKLGFVIIDEQHKFGVSQRAALKEKAQDPPHLLLMTATPIPRTLAFTLYGDLDISTIRELPKGRQPVRTVWVSEEKRPKVYEFLDQELGKGRQGYVICPRIEEAGEALASAQKIYKELEGIFSHRKVALLHGKLKSPEKKKIMQDFKDRKIDLLVSTVVIEVGIDVPNASTMLIENAERFGLSQLHQLRGRVGRGSEESYCILFSESTGEETAERLGAFEKTQSGFDIAEKDLEIRGAGDIIGEKQHGFPELRIGDFVKDLAILERAKREAAKLIEKDPKLALPKHKSLRKTLKDRFGLKDSKLALTA